MARIAKAICPHCDAELVEDECFDTRFEEEYITQYIAGHCPTCEKEFQWAEVYAFESIDELEEVT